MFRIFNQVNQTLWLLLGIFSLCLSLPLVFAAQHSPQAELNQAKNFDSNLSHFPNTQYVYTRNNIFQTDFEKAEDLEFYDLKPM